MFPREMLNLRADDLANVVARRVSGRRGVGGLVSPFLVKLANELRSDQIVPTFELSNAVLGLLAAALCEQLGCESPVRPETRRHALIVQIKAFIDARLDDPELTTATIAAAHYISPRYLQKLFEAEGSTVTDWIRRRRLDHCRRELLDPRHAGEPISTIAARWGLLDSSHFSRLFRATYGMSPREFRSERIVPA
jgi:AraC-like DNA-binding protein